MIHSKKVGVVHSDAPRVPRRRLLLSLTWLGGSVSLAACKRAEPVVCSQGAEPGTREQLGYVEQARDAMKTCNTCKFYEPVPRGLGCGACKVMPGKVNELGSCNVWVANG